MKKPKKLNVRIFPSASQQDVEDFLEAVYPEVSHLAASVLGEKQVLNDATEVINKLRAENGELLSELEDRRNSETIRDKIELICRRIYDHERSWSDGVTDIMAIVGGNHD